MCHPCTKLSFNSTYSKGLSVLYTFKLHHLFTSLVLQSLLGNTPGITLPEQPETRTASRFFSIIILQLSGSIPPTKQNSQHSSELVPVTWMEVIYLSSVVLPALVVLVQVVVPIGFRVSCLLLLLLADRLVLAGRGLYGVTFISSHTAGP